MEGPAITLAPPYSIPANCVFAGGQLQLSYPGLFRTREVVVYHGPGVVTPNFLVEVNGHVIGECFSHYPLNRPAASSVYPELMKGWDKPRDIDNGALVCGGPHGADSYWHWLFDYFPRYRLIRQFGCKYPLIVNDDLSDVQCECLVAIGENENLLQKQSGEALSVKNLFAPSFLAQTGVVYPEAVRFLREFRLPGSGMERIYVSRRGIPERNVENEAEIENFLQARGFSIVVPHEMSWREQRKAFSDAKVIIGPHGGGLGNAVFSPEGAKVLELATKAHTAHACLAAVCGHEHHHMLPNETNFHMTDLAAWAARHG